VKREKHRNRTTPCVWILSGLLLVFLALTSGAAFAQNAAQCANADKLGRTRLQVTQQNGRVLIEMTQPNSSGRKLDVEYGDESYVGRFDRDGKARLGFVLTEPQAEITIRAAEIPAVTCKIEVPEFAKIFRVLLRWREPVQLDLHVIEPGRRLGEAGHISPAQPNNNLAQGIGQIDVVSGAPAEGTTAEVSYVVANRANIPTEGVYGYRVEYVTRGMKPEPPYCDEHPLASAVMELMTIDRGKVTTRKIGTNRVPCGEQIPEGRRYMVVRP